MRFLQRHILALLALFVALGGTGYAATTTTGTSELVESRTAGEGYVTTFTPCPAGTTAQFAGARVEAPPGVAYLTTVGWAPQTNGLVAVAKNAQPGWVVLRQRARCVSP